MYFKYWDSDPYIRRVIGKILMEKTGLKMIVPDPSYGLLSFKGDRKYSFKRNIIDRYPYKCFSNLFDHISKYNMYRANGNFDIVLYGESDLHVIEVKTRLIPRIFSKTHDLSTVCVFLGYHLSSIKTGENYWERLKGYKGLERLLDNPASIGELYKSVVASLKYFSQIIYNRVFPGVLIPTCKQELVECTAKHLMDMYKSLLENMECFNKSYTWFDSVEIGIPRLYCYDFNPLDINENGIPRELVIKIFKADNHSDSIMVFNVENFDKYFESTKVSGCRICKYFSICRRLLYR